MSFFSDASDTDTGSTSRLELFRQMINHLPEELFIKDCEGRIVLANKAKVKGLGFSSEDELLGKTVFDLFPPEAAALFRADELRVTGLGETLLDYKLWNLFRDGAERVFSDSKIPIYDPQGEIQGYLGIWRDITDSHRVHHDLLKEKSLTQSFFDHVPNRIYFKDEQGRYLRVNRAFLQACGLAREEDALGLTAFDFFEDEYAQKTQRDERHIMDSGQTLLAMVEKQLRKDAAFTWSITSQMPLRDHEGKIIGTMGISHDITELRRAENALRESEALFRSVWDKSQDGMRLTDKDGVITGVNEAFCRLYGKERDRILGHSLTELYSPDDAEGSLLGYKRRFEEGDPIGSTQISKKLWDGREIDIEISYARIEPSPGNFLYLSILRDVTARRRREAEQYELEKNLLEAQRLESLGLMAGGVAHDFNNMLTGIFGHLGLAAEKLPPDSPAKAELERVERICAQASELCRKMLAYSGRGRFEIESVDLNDMLCDMGELIGISLSMDIKVHYHWHPSLPHIQADISQLRQVALNLVINANEAMENRAGQIRISTGLFEVDENFLQKCSHDGAKPGTYVYMEVADDGCGMSSETCARIFEPFFTTKFTGRGLGLAAVLGIVKGHQGALFVQSEPGKGSLFRFLLPNPQLPEPVPVLQAPVAALAAEGGLLLIVDDEEALRLVMERMLESQGYEIVLARDGQEAVEIFRERPEAWSGVIMDRTMPRLTGDEALLQMRTIRGDVPILLMSGYSTQDSAKTLPDPKSCLFIPKPFRMKDLLEKLGQLLQKRG